MNPELSFSVSWRRSTLEYTAFVADEGAADALATALKASPSVDRVEVVHLVLIWERDR